MENNPAASAKRPQNKGWFLVAIAVLVIVLGTAGAWRHWHHATQPPAQNVSLVPAAVSQAVNFPIYYPDPKKLPAGYKLDTNSFTTPVKDGANYSVSYGPGKKLVFSLQAKPSDSELQSFESSYIPLNIDYQTPSGDAKIGAYNNHGAVETLVSLPTNGNAWLIITAPSDINQTDLKQILWAIKH